MGNYVYVVEGIGRRFEVPGRNEKGERLLQREVRA